MPWQLGCGDFEFWLGWNMNVKHWIKRIVVLTRCFKMWRAKWYPKITPVIVNDKCWSTCPNFYTPVWKTDVLCYGNVWSTCPNFYTPVWKTDVLCYGNGRPSVRLSVRPSVRPSFPDFFQRALRYQFDTWYMHSVGGTTCRVWVSSQLGHFDLVYSQK